MNATPQHRAIPWLPLIIWLPVAVALLVFATSRLSADLGAVPFSFALGGGLIGWTLFEYLLHRYLFHWERKDWIGRVMEAIHGKHHDNPDDLALAIVPPQNAFLILLPVTLCLACVLPLALLPAFIGAFILGYLAYEYLHLAIHAAPLTSQWGRRLQRNHLAHHHSNSARSFGVTSPLWDFLFGTRRDNLHSNNPPHPHITAP